MEHHATASILNNEELASYKCVTVRQGLGSYLRNFRNL
jgi:hypothetical protein